MQNKVLLNHPKVTVVQGSPITILLYAIPPFVFRPYIQLHGSGMFNQSLEGTVGQVGGTKAMYEFLP